MMKSAYVAWAVVIHALTTAAFTCHHKGRVRGTTLVQMSVPNAFDTLTSGLSSICRLPSGVTVSDDTLPGGSAERPRLVELFDIENDSACRAVRERVTELDLVVERVVPAASNSRVFLDDAYEYALPAETSIPRLVAMDASGEQKITSGEVDIISYLNENFANVVNNESQPDESVLDTVVSVAQPLTTFLVGALRFGRGTTVSPAAQNKQNMPVPRPSKALILYSYEGNQFCRLVREVLTELDLAYELRSAGKASPRREELAEITGGSSQCPFLIDPNTDTKMAESADIIRYLYKNYALWTPPNGLLQSASNSILPLVKPLFSALAPLQAGSSGDKTVYEADIAKTRTEIESEVAQHPVVIYTYSLSPFSTECKGLLDNLGISYKEISLGMEWMPGLISDPLKRAALFELTGQSSLPHVFIGGKSIGGLFSGSPGLVPALEEGSLLSLVDDAKMDAAGVLE